MSVAFDLTLEGVRELVHRLACVLRHRREREWERPRAPPRASEAPHAPGDRLEADGHHRLSDYFARLLPPFFFVGVNGSAPAMAAVIRSTFFRAVAFPLIAEFSTAHEHTPPPWSPNS